MLYTILSLVHFILFLIAAFEIISSSKPFLHKVLWMLLILLLPLIGLIIYFVAGRSK